MRLLGALLPLLLLVAAPAAGEGEFRKLLASVARQNVVILSPINCGYVAFANNWLVHARAVGVHNFLFVSEDAGAHNYLQALAPGHVVRSSDVLPRAEEPPADGDTIHGFGSREFGQLMARRSHYVHAVLAEGFSALLLDTDAVLLRDPLPYLPLAYDYVGVYDSHPTLEWGRRLCTCLMLLRPSPGAMALARHWGKVCAHAGEDQLCFNALFPDLPLDLGSGRNATQLPSSPQAVVHGERLELSTFILPRQVFPSGNCLAKAEASLLGAWNSPVWVHANWLSAPAKQPFLQKLGLWKPSTAVPPPVCRNETAAPPAATPARHSLSETEQPSACPRYVLCDLISGGLGDLLEHYTHCLYVAQLIKAKVVAGPGAFTHAPAQHLGGTDYPAAAELLGISLASVERMPQGVAKEPIPLRWQQAAAFARGNATLPCSQLFRVSMAACDIRWCSNDPEYKGLQAVRWQLRAGHPRRRCLARGLGYPARTAATDPLRVVWHVRTGDVTTDMRTFGGLLATLRSLADERSLRLVFESQQALPAALGPAFGDAEVHIGSPLLETMCRFLTADVLVLTGSSFPALVAAFAPPWTPIVLEERRKKRGRRDTHHAHHYFTSDEALLLEDGAAARWRPPVLSGSPLCAQAS